MSTPVLLMRNFLIPRQSRRRISNSSGRRNSTSPQRKVPELVTSPKRFKDIPGPLALPMLRHSAHVLPRIGNFHHAVGLGLLEGLRQRYGDLVRLAKASRTRPVLYVFDPEVMKEVYDSKLTEPPQWERSPLYEQRKTTTNQSSIQGDQRKEIWAAIRTLLLDGTLQKSFDKAFDDIAEDFTRRLGELRFTDNALNEEISTEVHRWALETMGVLVLGGRLGCLDGAAHVPTYDNRPREKTSLDDDIPDTCSLSKRCIEELKPAERFVRISLEISNGGFLVRSEDTLKRESETFKRALVAFDDHYSLTQHFLLQAVQSLTSENLRPEQILVDKLRPLQNRVLPLVADILLAGVDLLAQTALSMFYQLSLNAARQQRAHDEVAWSVASKDVGADCAALPYISACAREALRIHPATGGVVRRSTGDMVVAGYEVPAGVDIVLAHGVSSKDEKQWGRAMSFVPERWCGEGWEPLKASRAHPMASMPFGENCPATGIVCKMLTSLATRVFDKYRIEWQGPPPNMVNQGGNKLQPPYYFVLQNASYLTQHFLLQAVQFLNSENLRPEQILVDKLRPLQNRVLPLVADILLAGVDPLAQTALSMFYQLSLNAARQQRAHDEVAWSVASKDFGADCAALPYISACAREALRIHPATGGVVRRSTGDMVVAGYEVPAGVDIVLAHGVSSKDEKQWGKAMSFVPERWCSEGWEPLKASRAHPIASMPFGENCPATGIVSKMLTSLATRVFDKYRLEWQGPPPNVINQGVNKLQPPYYFVLQNAS